MNDLIDGRVMLLRMHEELCYDIACRDCSMCNEDGGCRVEEWIDKFQSADAVSVVRCKECKWAKANGTYQWCGRLDSTARITADDYCSYGERKGGE